MNIKLSFIASSVLLAVSTPSLANSNNEASIFDEVVVSGTRSEQSVKNIPSTVSKVTAEQMEKNLATDVKQALKYEPGVTVNGRGRFGMQDFTIRGMSGNRVKMLIDGVEQPISYNPGADVMRKNSNTIEVDTLTAIEINKGPSSSLYGSDALGGSVFLRTKNPEDMLDAGDDSHVGVTSGYSSADEQYKLGFEVANRSGDLESMLIYTYRNGHETDTYYKDSNEIGNARKAANPFDIASHNVLAKIFYQINGANRVGFTAEYYTRSADGRILSSDGKTVPMRPPMPPIMYSNNRADDHDHRLRLGLEHEWLAEIAAFDSLEWKLNWTESESKHNSYDKTNYYGNRNRYRDGTDDTIQLDIQMKKELELTNNRHEITYGVSGTNNTFDITYTDYNLDKGTSKPGPEEVPKSKSEKRAVFVQDQMFMLDEKLVVTAGLRYDDYQAKPDSDTLKDHKSDAFTGRLGAVYHFTDNFSTYGQFTQGFRAPTIHELYYDKENLAHGYKVISNPNLKPEESDAVELGLRLNGHLGSVATSVFYNNYKNFIKEVTTYDSNDIQITTNENVDKAKIYGAELKTSIWLDEALNAPMGTYANFSVAYTRGEDKKTGRELDTVAPLTAVLGLGYDSPDEMWGGVVDVTMVATKDKWQEEDHFNTPGYTVVDMTTYYRPSKDLTVRAGLFNAFDKKYWQYQNIDGITVGKENINRKTEPGRNWGVNVKYDF
ncbi:TonB-dependent hemoglobin/transferrin/lactoferrin family receptor [Photobacterium damselae subsp. damselae]|uniref:TonB-dependent hemoglobin/transferrin/lactoferrin family receptor n=1 Tax=Photobacterium damselae TaxID=38293 RepID=UPI0010FD7AEB|nr:TonB-dependent hemoglobin/transferrin/lactoferrin family receptor [Photobacterium damselae]MBA5682229.1 TonB-dependent hemoglobin/transferrin/lactoferrin family receptor [Photobacterium damselae subsp. damselae]NVH52053.1 TonB-dependent hemoglobin/transferrin/lactoferrin family receptor [Photobacterium damselae subsp. damselae]NVO80858.1 TonB-dependent hemoglobin/transferrin/lactoferrin family receptor [Photobacterium damselae subsp. damselae]TLS82103.1 TonB-dependent hemoglobin/transferrin/